MSKLANRCSVIFIATSLSGLLSACPSDPPPNTNVRPIPSTPSGLITPTPAPSSIIQPPMPGPGQPGATPDPNFPGTSPSGAPTGLAIATTALPTAVLNFNYSFGLQVTGGSGAYRWSVVSGNLPNSLSLDPNTGQIFGRATQTGTFSFEVQVIDNQTGTVARRNLFVLVSDTNTGVNTLSVLTNDLPTGVVNRRYSRTLEVSGGVAPFSWTISAGSLPDGLRLNTTTGEINGTPTLRGEETFTVRVSDAQGRSQTRTLSITINRTDSDITVLTPNLPPAVSAAGNYTREVCNQSFSGQLVATGGDSDYRWQIARGSLPPGWSMSQAGNITRPAGVTTAGSYTFTARVDDGEENSASKVFTIDVSSALIHDFTPDSGSRGLRVILSGEGFDSLVNGDQILFGGVAAAAINTATDVNTGAACHQLTTHVPTGAKTGVLALQSGAVVRGISAKPFVAEDVVLNEVFMNPDSATNQFVELRNRSSAAVSIAGWFLHYTGVNGAQVSFEIPSETPPLAAGAVTVINIARNGGTSASNIYTGTGVQEMRFDPLNATATDTLTQVALCKGNPCATTATTTNYRDYLQFGNTNLDGGALENEAVTAGIWTDNQTLSLPNLIAPLNTVSATATDANAAHFGVAETGNDRAGLLVTDGQAKFTGYTVAALGTNNADAVLYYTPVTGALANQEQRVRRTVTGIGAVAGQENRVRLSAPIFEAKIQATNTGDGAVGNGLLVDTISMLAAPSALPVYAGDLVNVIAGGTIRTIQGLTAGPRIELDQVPFVSTQAANDSNGVTGNGFLVGAGEATQFQSVPTVNVTYVRDSGNLASPQNFSVVRTVNAIPAGDRLRITEPLATATVQADNEGDGTPGREIAVNTVANFATNDRVLYNGQPCVGGPCTITVGGTQMRLSSPVARMVVSHTNTGVGSDDFRLEVDNVTGFAQTNNLMAYGKDPTLTTITPAFGADRPRVQLSENIEMALANTTGDGVTEGIQVSSTEGFLRGHNILINGVVRRIDSLTTTAPFRITLNQAVSEMTVTNTNTGDGSNDFPLAVGDASGFVQGNTIRFMGLTGTPVTRTISNITGNNIRLSAAVTSAQSTLTAETLAGGTTVTVAAGGLFVANQRIRFTATNQVAQIQSIAGNVLTLTAPLAQTVATGAAVVGLLNDTNGVIRLVPTTASSGVIRPRSPEPRTGNCALAAADPIADIDYCINLVPKAGQFTLLPYDNAGNLQARISRIPTSGSIYLAPRNGVLRKFHSIKLTGDNLGPAGYTANSAPTPGTL